MLMPTLRNHLLSASLLLLVSSRAVYAEKPSIEFDFGRTAACREVPAAEANGVSPSEKIVELKLRVSVHLMSGNLDDVEEVRIEVGDSDRRLRVYSFEPSTRLESHVSEDIQWSKTIEVGNSLGASLGGQAPVLLGDAVAYVTPSINGGKTSREVVTESQKRIAPKHVVVASGTLGQEHGVFFKLRRSPQSSLEGVHQLTVRFVVPKTWRGDSLQVCCRATGQEKFLWLKQQATWAHKCSAVAVYLANDLGARRAAERHVRGS